MKKIYMYLLNTMADWEHGYFLQALSLQKMLPSPQYEFYTFAITKEPIYTASGLKITPDYSLDEIEKDDISVLLLIGADTWLEAEQERILYLAEFLLKQGKIVAGICGATLGLAKKGILNNKLHTSNALFFLTSLVENYKGIEYYKDEVAVCDDNLITASSAGSLLWAKYIIEKLNIYSNDTIKCWYEYFSTGKPEYFSKMIETFKI